MNNFSCDTFSMQTLPSKHSCAQQEQLEYQSPRSSTCWRTMLCISSVDSTLALDYSMSKASSWHTKNSKNITECQASLTQQRDYMPQGRLATHARRACWASARKIQRWSWTAQRARHRADAQTFQRAETAVGRHRQSNRTTTFNHEGTPYINNTLNSYV